MDVTFEPFDPTRHEAARVADLIFEADVELNELALGPRTQAVDAIVEMMGMDNNFYVPRHVRCVTGEGDIVGIVVGFYGRDRRRIEMASGMDFFRVFGGFAGLRRIPTWMKMSRLVINELPDDAYYVHSLAVAASHRDRGIGSQVIDMLSHQHGELYLEVNESKEAAQRFYERNGFELVVKNSAKIRGKRRGTYTLRKPDS